MHYLTLATAEIPPQEANPLMDLVISEKLASLKQEQTDSPQAWQTRLEIEHCNNMRDSFSRAVMDAVAEIMDPYSVETENPDYLEFYDQTEELTAEYATKRLDCFQLANGQIVTSYAAPLSGRFIISGGKVYKRRSGPLQHPKRNKQAKRMKALPDYPINRLYPTLQSYAEDYNGYTYCEQQRAYGYYYNPNAFCDWYSIGGRWAALFLVKEDCQEFSIGKRCWTEEETAAKTPKGYKWVCAARKKDIEWQAMDECRLNGLKNHFRSLEKLFLSGERDEGIAGTVTDEGIVYYGTLTYRKGEDEASFLKRRGLPENMRYPIRFHGYLSDEYHTIDEIPDNPDDKNPKACTVKWQQQLDAFIDSLPDDRVLIGVDCHG